jgi:hypothetical protein
MSGAWLRRRPEKGDEPVRRTLDGETYPPLSESIWPTPPRRETQDRLDRLDWYRELLEIIGIGGVR